MTLGELDGLTQHHAKGYLFDAKFMGYLQSLTDIIAIFHKCLLGQVRVEGFHKTLTLATTINHNTFRIRGLRHCHAFANTLDKSFFGEGLYDARDTNNANVWMK